MELSKFDLKSLKSSLRSEMLEKLGKKLRIAFVINAFVKGYAESYTGCFHTEIFDFEKAAEAFNKVKDCLAFEEVQFRAYGYYGNSIYDGQYAILAISRPNTK